MPTYVYETIPEDASTPPRRFEFVQRMSDDPLQVDPETGQPVRRVITGGLGFLGDSSKSESAACEASPAAGPCCAGGMCGLN